MREPCWSPKVIDPETRRKAKEYLAWPAVLARHEAAALDAGSRRALEALRTVAGYLGDDWPQYVVDTDGHPLLANLVLNTAPWTREYALELASQLQTIDGYPRSTRLLKRIRRRDQAMGALLELDVISHAIRGGLDVVIDPELDAGGRADLQVGDGTAASTVEIASVNSMPLSGREAADLFDRVYPTPWVVSWGLVAGGTFHGIPEPDEIPGLEEAARRFWEDCRAEPGPRVLESPRLLIWSAPAGDGAAIARFHELYGPDFTGPSFDPRPIDRIVNRILRKAPQAGPGGVVVIEPPYLVPHPGPEALGDVLLGALERSPELAGVILLRRAVMGSDRSIGEQRIGQYLYIARVEAEVHMRESVTVLAPNTRGAPQGRLIEHLARCL